MEMPAPGLENPPILAHPNKKEGDYSPPLYFTPLRQTAGTTFSLQSEYF